MASLQSYRSSCEQNFLARSFHLYRGRTKILPCPPSLEGVATTMPHPCHLLLPRIREQPMMKMALSAVLSALVIAVLHPCNQIGPLHGLLASTGGSM